MLIVSTRGLGESTAQAYQTEWTPLIEHLARCALSIEPRKESIPLLNFCEFQGGIRLEHAHMVHAAMLDYDKCQHENLTHVLSRAQAFRGFAYTTHSHGLDGLSRFRVCLALDRPCPAPNWDHVWHRLARILGTFSIKAPDRSTRDPGRFFFQPAQNPQGPPAWFGSWDGPLLSLDELLKPDPTGGQELVIESELEQSERVGFSDVQQVSTRLLKKTDSTLQMLGRAIAAGLRGESYAADGYRNDVTYKMAGELAKVFPRADAQDLAEKFRASFELQGEPTTEQFAGMLRRQQLKHQQYEADKRAARQLRSPEGPPQEPVPGQPAPPPDLPLVVQRAGHYWFRRPDSQDYARTYSKDDADIAFLREFDGIVHTLNSEGKVIPLKQQLEQYSQVALRVDATYNATSTEFNPVTRVLTLNTAPRRKGLTPEHVPEVDGWLHALGGDQYEDVLHWIQGLFRLDWPCPALYLWGPKHTGKTMLAHGLAHVWEHPPTRFATVLQSFNSGLSQNPLVLADEGFPPETKFTYVREFLTENVRSVNEKYRPHFRLCGYVRLLVTANNPASFELGRRGLTAEDADAIGERVIQVNVKDAARRYLENLGATRVTEEKIAKHALWLATHPQALPTGRWVMTSTRQERSMFQAGLVDSDYAWFVAWLAGYLGNPRSIELRHTTQNPDAWLVRTNASRLLVATTAYKYVEDCDIIRFKQALRFFSRPDQVQLRVPENTARKVKYHWIDVDRFFSSAQEYLDRETMIQVISQDSEDRIRNQGAPDVTAVRKLRIV